MEDMMTADTGVDLLQLVNVAVEVAAAVEVALWTPRQHEACLKTLYDHLSVLQEEVMWAWRMPDRRGRRRMQSDMQYIGNRVVRVAGQYGVAVYKAVLVCLNAVKSRVVAMRCLASMWRGVEGEAHVHRKGVVARWMTKWEDVASLLIGVDLSAGRRRTKGLRHLGKIAYPCALSVGSPSAVGWIYTMDTDGRRDVDRGHQGDGRSLSQRPDAVLEYRDGSYIGCSSRTMTQAVHMAGCGQNAGAGRDVFRAGKDCVWQWVKTHVRSAYAGKSPIHWRDIWSISVEGGGLLRGGEHVDKEADAEQGRMG